MRTSCGLKESDNATCGHVNLEKVTKKSPERSQHSKRYDDNQGSSNFFPVLVFLFSNSQNVHIQRNLQSLFPTQFAYEVDTS